MSNKYDDEYYDRRRNDVDSIANVPDSAAPNVLTTNLTKTQLEVFGSQRVHTCGQARSGATRNERPGLYAGFALRIRVERKAPLRLAQKPRYL